MSWTTLFGFSWYAAVLEFFRFIISPSKPPGGYNFLMFLHCHKMRSKIGTAAKFGGSVASTIWSEQPAIETTTRMDIMIGSELCGVCVHSVFNVKSMFAGSTTACNVCKHVAVKHGRVPTSSGAGNCQHASRSKLKCIKRHRHFKITLVRLCLPGGRHRLVHLAVRTSISGYGPRPTDSLWRPFAARTVLKTTF